VNTYLSKTEFNVRHVIDKGRSIDLVEILNKFRHSYLTLFDKEKQGSSDEVI